MLRAGQILGIDKSASDRDIKRAYRTQSKKWHPDKNPDNPDASDTFRSVAEAYEALSDAESRRIYDRYGAEGLKQHQQQQQQGSGGQRHDPFDLFSRFFGGGGGGGQRQGPNMEVTLPVSLRDFYTGAQKTVEIDKQHVCDACDGTGSSDGHTQPCADCGGRGMRITKHMLAPGIFQQVQSVCDTCGGRGHIISHPCSVCGGAKVVRAPVSLTVHIEPGLPNRARLTFEGEADESPDWVAGDLVVNVVLAPPSDAADAKGGEDGANDGDSAAPPTDGTWFRRKGADLYWTEVLSLREALLGGWTRNLTHLDGHVVRLARPPGHVVQPRLVEHVHGEGMPRYRDELSAHGDLVVQYEVVLPDLVDPAMLRDLAAVFDRWRAAAPDKLDKDEL